MIASFKLVNLGMSADSFDVLQNAARRVLTLRRVGISVEGNYTVTLALDQSLKDDRYIIAAKNSGADIVAANDCAAHAAFGRLMLESKFDGRGGFIPLSQSMDFTPAKPLRGMYFATHFHNFYHNAPIEQVYEVIEDLALRGCNSLLVWFDMHHYHSMEDEGAQELVQRLRAMLKYANKIGMAAVTSAPSIPRYVSRQCRSCSRYIIRTSAHTPLSVRPTASLPRATCSSRRRIKVKRVDHRSTLFTDIPPTPAWYGAFCGCGTRRCQ